MAKIKDLEIEITDWTVKNTPARMAAFLALVRKNKTEAAALLGVSITTISRWANGHYIPDFRARRSIQNIVEAAERGLR
jgi:transcriptional regulator with XRE-family HTH domain